MNPNRDYKAWVPTKVVAKALIQYGYKNKIKVRAVYFDEIDKKYFSDKFEIDILDWLKE